MDKLVDSVVVKTGSIVTFCVHADRYIGNGKILVVFVLAVDIDDLTEDADGVSQLIAGFRSTLNSHANDDVCTHFACDVCRVVVAQTTVNQHFVTNTDRRECGRNGHGCSHGLWEAS